MGDGIEVLDEATRRAREHVEEFIERQISQNVEATHARLVRKGWARYVERSGQLEVELTDAGLARAELLRQQRAGN